MLARLWRERDGAIGAVAAGAVAMMVAAGALAVDGSHLHVEQNKLQTTVDEVALAAAQRLASDPEAARRQARLLARLGFGLDDEDDLDAFTAITFGRSDPEQRAFSEGRVRPVRWKSPRAPTCRCYSPACSASSRWRSRRGR